jgi:hypothetical protein
MNSDERDMLNHYPGIGKALVPHVDTKVDTCDLNPIVNHTYNINLWPRKS